MKNNFGKLLEDSNIGVEEVSKATDIGIRTLKNFLLEISSPNLYDLVAICVFFNCSLDYLFCRTDIKITIR